MRPRAIWQGADLVVDVHVQPRAARDEVLGIYDGRLKIRISAPPVDGKANRYLIGFLAQVFGVPRRDILLLAGETGRDKRFRIVAPKTLPDCITKPDRQ